LTSKVYSNIFYNEYTLNFEPVKCIFYYFSSINNNVERSEKYTRENCQVKTEICVLNNLESDSHSFKAEPEDLDNSFQP